jgi:hypothetical protein
MYLEAKYAVSKMKPRISPDRSLAVVASLNLALRVRLYWASLTARPVEETGLLIPSQNRAARASKRFMIPERISESEY